MQGKGPALPFVFLAAAAVLSPLVAFAPSLPGGFVWDDRDLIVESPGLANLRPVSRFFHGDFWSQGGAPRQSGYYRPLTLLSYAAQRAVWGLHPRPYRIANLVAHALVVLCVLALCRGLGLSPIPAALVAFVFSVHPVHVESVAWISGRTDILASLLALAALLLVLPGRSAGWLPLAAALLLAGLLCKESCAALPAIVLLPAFGPLARRVRAWGAFLAALGIYATVRLQAVGAPGMPSAEPLFERIGSAGRILVAYAAKVAFPLALPVDHQVSPAGALAPAFALLFVAVPAGGVWLALRGRLEGVGLLVFWLGLLPSIGLVPIHERSAIRFLYLPVLGLLLVVAPGLASLAGRLPRPLAGSAVAAILIALTAQAANRSRDFASDEALFRAERRLSPASLRMALNLGETLRRGGKRDETAAYYAQLRQEGLDVPEVNVALIRSLREATQVDRSAEEGSRIVARFPRHAPAHAELGLTFLAQGYRALGRGELEEAIALDPTTIPARANLGLLFAQMGRTEEALATLDPGLSREPRSRELLQVKAHALHRGGRYPEALAIFEDLVARHPDRIELWLELSDVSFASGMYAGSRHASTMALTLAPRDLRPLQQLARVDLAEGKIEDALRRLRRAIEIAPGEPELRTALITLLLQTGDPASAVAELDAAERQIPGDKALAALAARLRGPAPPP